MSSELSSVIEAHLADVPDFPVEGVVFKDITPLVQDAGAFREVIAGMADRYRGAVDVVAGIESRGFIFGAALAYELGVGMVLIRKEGKLPRETHSVSYDLEYGSATIEVHRDAFTAGQRVLLLDDVLATGGTAAAAAGLVETCGATVTELAFILELSFLAGRATLGERPIWSLHTV